MTKKVDGAYEVALIVDGVFKRSGVGKDALALLVKLCGPIIQSLDGEGTEVAVQIGVLTAAEITRFEAKQARAKEAQAAEEEAAEIARLTAAVKAEKQARAAALIETATVQG